MPKYLIERDIPGAGNLSQQELQAISQKSCGVLGNLGPSIQWQQSYVTGGRQPAPMRHSASRAGVRSQADRIPAGR